MKGLECQVQGLGLNVHRPKEATELLQQRVASLDFVGCRIEREGEEGGLQGMRRLGPQSWGEGVHPGQCLGGRRKGLVAASRRRASGW